MAIHSTKTSGITHLMVKLTSSEMWNGTSLHEMLTKYVRLYELAVFAVFAIVLLSVESSINWGKDLPIPEGYGLNRNETVPNLLYSYPIYFGGHECWPNDLSVCLRQASLQTSCCDKLRDSNSFVYESVTTVRAVILSAIISVGYLIIRAYSWKIYLSKSNFIKVDYRYWYKILWDTILGLVFAVILSVVVTDYIKRAVGAPRPIYYALKLFASVHSSVRQGYEDNATLSFPSGHASTSLASLGYTTLVCLHDVKYFKIKAPNVNLFLTIISFVPLVVAIYIGVSRIVDVWHFFWDVLGGWLVGASAAVICIYFFSGHGLEVSRTVESLETSKDKGPDNEPV